MSNLPKLEVFLRSDPLEAVAVSDPPVNVEQPIFQTVNLDGVLTDDDIGVTVQGFDADAVIDADYSTIKAKVNTIEEGAQVNPDLSLYAPKSNAVFTDSLTLPNNSRINGVEHFYQTTKPIARGDNSPLVIGDRWWRTNDGTEWYWNGTYWVGSLLFNTHEKPNDFHTILSSPSSVSPPYLILNESFPILLTSIVLNGRVNSPTDVNNYWTIQPYASSGFPATIYFDTLDSRDWDKTFNIRPAVFNTNNSFFSNYYDIRWNITKIGNPGVIAIWSARINYRRVYL